MIQENAIRTVGAYEAKTHLPQLLDEVRRGGTITITKRGIPVARLIPPEDEVRARRLEAIDELRHWRENHNWKLPEGMTIQDMIEEGRRF